MPLRTPVLDDRSYAQLRDELIARIPVYAPEWTDHHPSDPGITLLELFAYLGENVLFRFNQIPDATKLAFLDLLDIGLRPAEPSAGHVRFELKKPTDPSALLPQGTKVTAGEIPFQTIEELNVWPISGRAAIRAAVTDDLDADTSEYVSRAAGTIGVSTAQISSYRTSFGASDPNRPGGDVLDPRGSIDRTIYVALTAPAGVDLSALAGGLLSIGVVPTSDVPSMVERARDQLEAADAAGDARDAAIARVAPKDEANTPPMQWQVCTTEPVPGADPAAADPVWLDLDVAGDTTGGLTGPGVVRLRMPADMSTVGVYVPGDLDAEGVGDQPPLVEDPEVRAELVAWLRVFRPTGGELAAIEWLDTNAASIEQALTASAEFVGSGTGDPSQTRSLVHQNVLGKIDFEVEEIGAGRWIAWTQVDDFRASGVDDRHVVVDRESGTVTCGDGRRGRPWQLGERLRVRPYRYGGGAAGNVGFGAISKAPQFGQLAVANPLPTRGGSDAEPLADAVARIPEEFRRHDRAVTVSDFRELAEATPGAGVARAETLRLFHPLSPEIPAPGVVSVVVWPDRDREHPGAPRPDRTMLDAVCRYLDARRLVTTELYVIPPTYRRIAVSVGISAQPGHGIESVRRWVELVLRQFLAPLPPYGPAGRGWPLGRRVFAPELEAAVLQVDGVEFIVPGQMEGSSCAVGLRLAEEDGDGNWVELGSRAVDLEDWEVPELAAITVVEGPALAPGVAIAAPPSADGPAIPVREPQEVC